MRLVAYLHIVFLDRLAELRRAGDRGDSPVPTAVIIFGLVAAAIAVTALVSTKAKSWMDAIPGPAAP
ncbi:MULTISPECIES: hypothetical protein [Micromonospora]|uniref:Uncharacterized protein n=1 Tax=Micromonospora yangpuensis TaxID=683228 RepID=A0A1C6TYC5_9ACTN|nr:hypothetical protein [Micromonospora yangpuensis]GGM20361.1 hypothetical protein GCM10012279_43420 [Micromonospora yangpuensis]SCL46805.1 hypothetical protein GA0070617_0391 [Micromonospora yangpuensis]